MSNNLNPDQARRFVGPDLVPNCLQKLSADDTWRYRVKGMFSVMLIVFYVSFFLSARSGSKLFAKVISRRHLEVKS